MRTSVAHARPVAVVDTGDELLKEEARLVLREPAGPGNPIELQGEGMSATQQEADEQI